MGVLRDAAQKDGLLAVSESLPHPTESLDVSAADTTTTQFKWLHANTKASRMTVLEHLKASEVRRMVSPAVLMALHPPTPTPKTPGLAPYVRS